MIERKLIYADVLEKILSDEECDVCDVQNDYDYSWGFSRERLEEIIKSVPIADAVPIVHEHWIPVEGETGVEAFGIKEIQICGFKCSGCNFEIDISEREFNYCPNCGAKMSEESAE